MLVVIHFLSNLSLANQSMEHGRKAEGADCWPGYRTSLKAVKCALSTMLELKCLVLIALATTSL